MKKILVCVLVLVLCITALVACNQPENTEGLDRAKSIVKGMYKDKPEITTGDFERVSQVMVGDDVFTVTWTVENLTGPITVTIEAGEGKVTIKVPTVTEDIVADTTYTLKATISDADGNTETLTFNHKVPKFQTLSFADYVAAAKDASVMIDGIVTGILPKGNGATANGFYMNVLDGKGGVYVYGDYTKAEGSADIAVGKTVRVTGVKDIYNGTHEIKNATYKVINDTVTTVTPVDLTAAYKAAADLKDAALSGPQALLVTVKGVTVGEPGDNGYYYFTLGDKQSYVRLSSSACPMTTAEQNAFKASFAEHFGYTADVTGLVTVYNDSFYLTPISADAFSNFVAPQLTDQQIVDGAKEAISIDSVISKAGEIELPTTVGGVYADATISWALAETTLATLAGNVLAVAELPAEEGTITLTATITSGEATDTKAFTVTINAAVVDDPNTLVIDKDSLGVTGAYGNGTAIIESIGFAFNELGYYDFGIQWRQKEGKISKLWNTDALANGIGSIVIVLNPGKTVYDNTDVFSFVFGTSSEELGAEIKLSTVANQYEYTITPDSTTYTYFSITKIIESYTFYVDSITINYAVECVHEFDNACDNECNNCGAANPDYVGHVDAEAPKCVCDVCQATLDHVDEDPADYVCDNCGAELCVHAFDNACDNECNNCGAANPDYVGHVDVEAPKCVCDVCQAALDHAYDDACDADCNVCGDTRTIKHQYDHNCDADCNVCGAANPAYGHHVDVTNGFCDECFVAVEIGAALEADAEEGRGAELTGTVDEIYQAWNSQYSNISFYISDGTNRILVYRAGSIEVKVGDVVTVTGTITKYNEVNQIAQGGIITLIEAHVCGDDMTAADCLNAEVCNICGATNGNALGHTDEENSDGLCDRCGTELSAGAEEVTVSNTIAALKTANNWVNGEMYSTFALDSVITVTSNGGANTGKYYDSGSEYRIYQTENPTLTITAAEGYEIVSVKIVYNNKNTGCLTYNSANVLTGNVVNVNASSITFGVGNTGSATNGQVKITSIEVVYRAIG